jgi:hypothetical protein
MPRLPRDDRAPLSCVRTQVRALWLGLDESRLPRATPPARLTPEDMEVNYTFRKLDGNEDAATLIRRVCAGTKPVATILLRCPLRLHLPEKTLVEAANRLGLAHCAFFTRKGRRLAAVFQPNATLAQYYDPDEAIALYSRAGVALDRELFDTPLAQFGKGVVLEDFPEPIKFPLLGLCLGYPVRETIDMLRSMRLLAKGSAQ